MTAPLFDVEYIETLLQASARAAETMSYSEVLNLLGMAFTRPKMRALCNILDEIDRRAFACDEPSLLSSWFVKATAYRVRAGGSGAPIFPVV